MQSSGCDIQQSAMSAQKLYLKPNVLVEPLVDRWYAWAHLIPPATAARNLSHRHLRIMDSYISSPESHAAAVRNPAMLGGPFMDFSGRNRVEEVAALRETMRSERTHLLSLSQALADLNCMLESKAKGFSLESLYAEIPAPLQGYVELVYDVNNRPSFRLLEPLLYKSSYYDRSLQSLVLSEISQDDRPFVLSTPRLKSEQVLELSTPFESKAVDKLAELKTVPDCFCGIKNALELPDEADRLLNTLLTDQQPSPYERYEGRGVRWRYFGHACILLEAAGVTILLDPVLSYTYESDISRYTYQELPDRIDFVLITHNHQDHILFETLLQIRHRVGTIVVPRNGGGALQDPSLKLTLKNCGFHNVVEVAEMDELTFPGGSITAIPFLGEHGDLNVQTKSGYLVRTQGHSLLFAADSCNISARMYDHVHAEIGDVDVLFVGMECDGAPVSWIYGPLFLNKLERSMDRSRRLAGSNFERAFAMVDRFRCKEVYVYAMGQEPWLNYIMSVKYTEQSNPIVQSNKLITTCRERGIVAERLFGEKEILLA
jgi:L-ascorbate metabolism protein UlaG (beta-lactamase superfamily)